MDKLAKFLIISLILISFGLRFYKSSEFFFWNIDEDRFALNSKRILVDHKPVLIGYALPAGEIYLGPIFPYITSVWYVIAGMNPTRLPILSALFGAISTFLVYKIGSTIFESKRIGLIAAFIYSFSFLANVYSRVLTELTLVPILSLLVYLFLYQNIKYKKPKNLIWLGLVLLVASQNEGSSFSLLVLVLVSFFLFHLKIPAKKLLQIVGAFIFFNIPVLFFELRHNFFITKAFIQFFFGKSVSHGLSFNFSSTLSSFEIFPKTLSRFLSVTGPKSISDQILPCSNLINLRDSSISPILLLTASAIFIFFLFRAIKNKKAIGAKILGLHIMVMLAGMLLYSLFFPGWFYEWLLVIFFPGLALISAYTLNRIFEWNKFGKILTLLFLGIFLIYNLRFLIKTRDNFGLSAKESAVKYALSQIENKPFYLDSIGSCYAQGYNYLFWFYGNFPKQSYADDSFTPTYYQKSTGPKPNLGVVIVNPSRNESQEFNKKYQHYQRIAINKTQIGKIEVLIVKE